MKRAALLLATAIAPTAAGAATAEALDCKADVDACVRTLVVETAVFMEACGNAYPASQQALNSTFKNWGVLRLPVPQLTEAIAAGSPLRAQLGAQVAAYLQRIPAEEREIECSSRVAMIKHVPLQLHGDSARLPPGALNRYTP